MCYHFLGQLYSYVWSLWVSWGINSCFLVFFLFMICSMCSHFYIVLSHVYCIKPDKFLTYENLFINKPVRGVKSEEWAEGNSENQVQFKKSQNKIIKLSPIQSAGTGSHKVEVSPLNRPVAPPQPQRRSEDDGELVSWCCVWGFSGTCLHE